MAQKKPFVVRLDPKLLKAVERWAADEFRSTNGQIEWLITRALQQAGRSGGLSSSKEGITDSPSQPT
jgi:hypothetical protein